LQTGKLSLDLSIGELDPQFDRVMLCGSPSMLENTCAILDEKDFKERSKKGIQGTFKTCHIALANSYIGIGKIS